MASEARAADAGVVALKQSHPGKGAGNFAANSYCVPAGARRVEGRFPGAATAGAALPPAKFRGPSGASPRAFILVGVLVLVMLLSMVVVSLLFRFNAEDTAASASVGTEQAWAAALSGVEEALRVASDALPGATDWQQNPGAFRDRLVFEDGADRWFFTVFSPGDDESLGEFRFGLTDEAAKLNVNALHDAAIEKLPRVTPALAAALRDFTDEDSTPMPEGAEQEYYSGLPRPYAIRDGPLASLDELLLVRGFTPALLHGSAAARATTAGDATEPRAERGLSQLLTIASYDPDTASDGTWRVNFNSADAVLPQTELPPSLTNFLAALRTNEVTLSHAADLLEARLPVKDAKGVESEITSGIGKAELATVLELFTASGELQTEGLINVNTASAAVLATLPGADDALAESIVSARGALSPDRKTTLAWLYQEGVVDAAKFKALAPQLTTRSFQFTFQVIGYGLPSGRFRVLEVGIDVAPGTRRITHLRDVTRRGLPFPLGGETEAQPTKSAKRGPAGQDSADPHSERREASAASISGETTPSQESRCARASFIGRWGSTESHPAKFGKEARRG
ncbi:MAG: general secretion pathway protein GspK [Verrucomicrobia bacterium]|nr:general secretion pathway protein GspK [Verrucomicrobiota bacterium]